MKCCYYVDNDIQMCKNKAIMIIDGDACCGVHAHNDLPEIKYLNVRGRKYLMDKYRLAMVKSIPSGVEDK